MKKMIVNMFAAMLAICTGCKSIPEDAKVYTVSYAVGAASAKVVDKTNISQNTTSAIVKTMSIMETYVPSTNETFSVKWMPIISSNIKHMVSNNEISSVEGKLVEQTFTVICSGLDYIIENRYPQISAYNNLMSAAIYGFNAGFLTYYDNENTLTARFRHTPIDMNEFKQVYKYLTK